MRELRYTEAAAWRRIKAMRLCRETRGVREWLQDCSLNLSNAALLQNSFERWDRNGGGPTAAGSPGAEANVVPRAGSAPSAPGGEAEGSPSPSPVLDARARQRLVEQAVGKSTRQVQQMLAEVDPEAAAHAERLRALGDGRWELKTVIDAECQCGLQQLRGLLSHVGPHLTVGQLVGRLVREGLDRYDPSRPPRRKPEVRFCGCRAFVGDSGAGDAGRARRACGREPASTREVREADGTRHGGRLAGRFRLQRSFAQERTRAGAGQPYFGAEARCAVCGSRQQRRRRGGDRADFGAEAAHDSRRIGGAGSAAEVPPGSR